ncbi:hypothetical protein SME38J_36000 [Serratia marcescens]|nr:hypothetical protein SME38J_36000 [Serratia marcescens]
MNKKINAIILLGISIISIPIGVYLWKFHGGLSRNSQDWGSFGSYLSGIYSSAFSFLSAMILIATLIEMRKANKQERDNFLTQLANSQSDKTNNDVIMLSGMINKLIDENQTIGNRRTLPNDLASQMAPKCRKYQVTEDIELYEAAIDLMREQRERFSSEIHVFGQLAKKVVSIEDEEIADTAKAIVKGLISDSYRF